MNESGALLGSPAVGGWLQVVAEWRCILWLQEPETLELLGLLGPVGLSRAFPSSFATAALMQLSPGLVLRRSDTLSLIPPQYDREGIHSFCIQDIESWLFRCAVSPLRDS